MRGIKDHYFSIRNDTLSLALTSQSPTSKPGRFLGHYPNPLFYSWEDKGRKVPKVTQSQPELLLWLTWHSLGSLELSALWGESEKTDNCLFCSTGILESSGETLSWLWFLTLRSPPWAQGKFRACELSLSLSQWETPARHLISLRSSIHKGRLITSLPYKSAMKN